MLKQLPPWYRRLMPDATYKRFLKNRQQPPPHGSLDGTDQEIISREAWFCHNYPMAECHYGAYALSDNLSIVFANDGYPDYVARFMEQWAGEQGIVIRAKTIERAYTTAFLVECSDLKQLHHAIWDAWKFRLGGGAADPAATIYEGVQAKTATVRMRELGLSCSLSPYDAS